MGDAVTWIVLLGVPAAVVASIVLQARGERRRSRALAAEAARLGLEFDPTGRGLFREDFARAPLFDRGFPRRARNLMRGPFRGRPAAAFDYIYMEGVGARGGRRNRQTVAALHTPGAPRRRTAPVPHGWAVERGGGWTVLYRPGVRVRPDALGAFLDEAHRLLETGTDP